MTLGLSPSLTYLTGGCWEGKIEESWSYQLQLGKLLVILGWCVGRPEFGEGIRDVIFGYVMLYTVM